MLVQGNNAVQARKKKADGRECIKCVSTTANEGH